MKVRIPGTYTKMDRQKLYILFRMYSNRLMQAGVRSRKGPTGRLMDLHMDRENVRWMCDEMAKILGPDDAEVDDEFLMKANRWLGFVQHALLIHGLHTIDEMKGHIR